MPDEYYTPKTYQTLEEKMYRLRLKAVVPGLILLALVAWTPQVDRAVAADAPTQAAAGTKKAGNVYVGKIVGKSNKAKTISITVGKGDKAKTMMVRFDDQSKGLEFAKKGEAAKIT